MPPKAHGEIMGVLTQNENAQGQTSFQVVSPEAMFQVIPVFMGDESWQKVMATLEKEKGVRVLGLLTFLGEL